MHRGTYKLFLGAMIKKRFAMRFHRALCFTLIFFQLVTPKVALGISPGKAAAIPEVAAALALILEINRRMERASLNPMNENYRKDVRFAVSLLPAAIINIAKVFKAGKQLHNADLPVVQALLGGFVDVGAPDRFKSFFKNPSKNLIPALGVNIPPSIKPASLATTPEMATSGAIAANQSQSAIAINPQGVSDAASLPSAQFVTLSGKASATKGASATEGYGYDESAAKVSAESADRKMNESDVNEASAVRNTQPVVGTAAANSRADLSTTFPAFMNGVASDLTAIESRMDTVQPTRTVSSERGTAPTTPTAIGNDQFFKKLNQSGSSDEEELEATPQKAKRKKRISREPASKASNYQLRLKPKFWKFSPLTGILGNMISIPARAQECPECAMGGGGGGGGGGGSAAEILMGLAAIIAAITPMVVASIQADADKDIAKTNADTAIKTAQMQSDTSKFLAETQKNVALQQAAISRDIAAQNNSSQSQRLNMQLAELRAAREDAAANEREKRAMEQQYNQERIALAKKQAEDNLKLAKQTLNANLTQAGLVSGASTTNSTDGLSVASTGFSGGAFRQNSNALAASTNTGTGNPAVAGNASANSQMSGSLANALSAASGNGGSLSSLAGALNTRTQGGGASLGMARSLSSVNSSRASRATQLLSNTSASREPQSVIQKKKVNAASMRLSRFAMNNSQKLFAMTNQSREVTPQESHQLAQTLSSSMASGSSRGMMNRLATGSALQDDGHGLRAFRQATSEVSRQTPVPYWGGLRAPRAVSANGSSGSEGHSSRGAVKAYRQPAGIY